jgi:methyl-accepting chemotaxis protein
MGISTLSTIITGDFITNIASGSGSSKPKIGLSKEPEEPLSVTLQRGARGAAASIQALNSGISYITIAADYTQNMLEVVNALDKLVQKAGKGNITPTNARLYRQKFDELAQGYEQLVAGSVSKGRDLLATDQIAEILKKGGLDADKVDELEAAFKKVTSFSGVEVGATGETKASGRLFPAQDFYRAVRQATRDPEDPPQNDDGSVAFQKIKAAVREIRTKVQNNIDALNEASELVQKNIALVRATGFALLDASKTVDGSQNPDTIALTLRGAIRSQAAGSLEEVHNLNAILAAGLLAVDEKDT